MQNEPTQIIVHHDGVSRDGDSFDVIDEYHKGRDFPISSLGKYVGYHFFIERSGHLIQAREVSDEGAHTTGQNFNSIGVGLAGNFDVELPALAQVDSLASLLARLTAEHSISPTSIVPHRTYAAKSCYGSRLPDDWAQRVWKLWALKEQNAKLSDVCNILRNQLGE